MKHASISYLRSLAYNAPRRENREHFTAVADEIDLLRTAGNNLEKQLMKLHRYHHGPTCETCQALDTWWTVNGR